jgi:CO/xanthine dehydrogenase Mo-binding subunit
MTTADYEPNVVLSTKEYDVIGSRPIRPDGADKVTGRALYGADYQAAGLLHGKVLRSPHAHGRIRSIDTSSEQHPFGVWGVGEANIIPPPAALANAIHNAIGVWMHELPMNPGAVLSAGSADS